MGSPAARRGPVGPTADDGGVRAEDLVAPLREGGVRAERPESPGANRRGRGGWGPGAEVDGAVTDARRRSEMYSGPRELTSTYFARAPQPRPPSSGRALAPTLVRPPPRPPSPPSLAGEGCGDPPPRLSPSYRGSRLGPHS